jgi:hypothetical protein
MVPDAPLFLHIKGYSLTHSSLGVVSVNLLMGLVFYYLWIKFLRTPVMEIIPTSILQWIPSGNDEQRFLPAALAVTLGAATHVIWDSFTHGYGFPVNHIEFLRKTLEPLGIPVYVFMQHLSSSLGAGALVIWSIWRKRKGQCLSIPHSRMFSNGVLYAAWGLLIPGALCYGAYGARTWSSHVFLYDLSVHTANVILICVGVYSVVFKLISSLRRQQLI